LDPTKLQLKTEPLDIENDEEMVPDTVVLNNYPENFMVPDASQESSSSRRILSKEEGYEMESDDDNDRSNRLLPVHEKVEPRSKLNDWLV
jgi:hypothetical protein